MQSIATLCAVGFAALAYALARQTHKVTRLKRKVRSIEADFQEELEALGHTMEDARDNLDAAISNTLGRMEALEAQRVQMLTSLEDIRATLRAFAPRPTPTPSPDARPDV